MGQLIFKVCRSKDPDSSLEYLQSSEIILKTKEHIICFFVNIYILRKALQGRSKMMTSTQVGSIIQSILDGPRQSLVVDLVHLPETLGWTVCTSVHFLHHIRLSDFKISGQVVDEIVVPQQESEGFVKQLSRVILVHSDRYIVEDDYSRIYDNTTHYYVTNKLSLLSIIRSVVVNDGKVKIDYENKIIPK